MSLSIDWRYLNLSPDVFISLMPIFLLSIVCCNYVKKTKEKFALDKKYSNSKLSYISHSKALGY